MIIRPDLPALLATLGSDGDQVAVSSTFGATLLMIGLLFAGETELDTPAPVMEVER